MLTNVVRRLNAAERAVEPRSLAVVAWFDGHARGENPHARPRDYPRVLDPAEGRAWREGWDEGRRARVCHAWHGFLACPADHPPYQLPPGDYDRRAALDHLIKETR